MEPINILHGILIGWWVANFAPIQSLIKKYIKPYTHFDYINTVLTCFKCLSFWATLIISLNGYEAITAAVIAYTYEKIMSGFKTYL
jgi:hypothetical protein